MRLTEVTTPDLVGHLPGGRVLMTVLDTNGTFECRRPGRGFGGLPNALVLGKHRHCNDEGHEHERGNDERFGKGLAILQGAGFTHA